MHIKQFIQSKLFIKHLFIILITGLGLLWFTMQLLNVYTRHGNYIQVPDLAGLTLDEAQELLDDYNLRYTLNDSIHDATLPGGTIARQDPESGMEVKRNRRVYLTIVAVLPEQVPMPNLVDLSFRQAAALLSSYGLSIGNLSYRVDIAQNAILEQRIGNSPIEAGTLVNKGTSIDLVIGQGLGQNLVAVPMLIGQTRAEAIATLQRSSLSVGLEDFLDEANDNPRVYQQTPDPTLRSQFLLAGQPVNLVYRSANRFDFQQHLSSIATVNIPMLFGKTPEEVRMVLMENSLELGNETHGGSVNNSEARVYRQFPEFDPYGRILKGTRVDVWYKPIDEF
ncbi:MAG TPA: hypothetical protein DCM62_04045 [Bacteroidales bacterium]|nr:hypothetical protein [Bacteroidales bacterium]